MNPFSLASNAALVTGSSQGIGLALALGIRAAGARVVFHGHNPRPADIATESSYLQADLLDPTAPAKLVADAFAAEPGLDLLVCNAGTFIDTSFLATDLARWERTINLNARATYFVAQAFSRELIARQRSGAMVLTSSTNGFQPEDDSTVYDSSKGAVVMMTRTLAQNLAAHRIRVNGLAPGLIRTPLTASGIDASPEKRALYEKKILQGRIGDPGDCVGAAVFLLSPASSYITGQILIVDGGLTLGQIGRL